MSMSGADLIRAERYRQIQSEHYTAEHDKGHEGELIAAAVSYANIAGVEIPESLYPTWDPDPVNELPFDWPWDAVYWKPTGNPKRDLIKAGALIAAAIDAWEARDGDA